MSQDDDGCLPELARRFLRGRQEGKGASIVRQLHRWIRSCGLELVKLQPEHVDQFLKHPFGTVLAKRTRYDYRGYLLAYLQWLYDQGQLSFDPSELRQGPLQSRPLPPLAEGFVQTLAVTLKGSTCHTYRTNLRRLCGWLKEKGVSYRALNRQHMTQWLCSLQEKGLHVATRINNILVARAYLGWLYEHGHLSTEPEVLLRRTDLPARPDYLPRPLSMKADRELQARLRASSNRYAQGLLLMRYTGIRIGELMSLELRCLRTDLRGLCFLKVPLGKLHNERLVPLDREAVQLVQRLQTAGHPERPWLLETPSGKQTYPSMYRNILRRACEGIEIAGRMTPHRLRHTYATTLLCGGMSLVGVMTLLGHRSYKTTLRYAAVTQETVGREYFEALTQIEKRYEKQLQPGPAQEATPQQMLSDVVRWIQKHIADEPRHVDAAHRLIRRLRRIEAELQHLIPPGRKS